VSAKPIVLLPKAEQDIYQVVEHYRREGGATLARRWAEAVEAALRFIGTHAPSGSPRYADMLGTPGLRYWQTRRFPYLIFYVERSAQVDIWRVLHGERDIAAWLRDGA